MNKVIAGAVPYELHYTKITKMVVSRIIILFLCAAYTVTATRECARWNEYLASTRTGECMTWASSSSNSTVCEDWGSLDDDVLRRRTSGLLAEPPFQGMCGSCWAFASAHAYTDRLSINDTTQHQLLSAMWPVTCFTDEKYVAGGNGCCGAKFLNSAFVFFQESGEISEDCYPYILEDITEDTKGEIKGMCPTECEDDKKFRPGEFQLKGYQILQTDEQVMEALEYGPVVTAITIPNDFLTYQCGIYQSCTNQLLSGHAVEVVDYGTFEGIDFWVVKNSWSTDWGEKGYFRIKRGVEYFGVGGYVAPIITPGEPVTDEDAQAAACADEEEDSNDMLVVCAAIDTVYDLNSRSAIQCINESTVATLTFDRVLEASVQVVEGVWIQLSIFVNVIGCSSDTLQATLNATVFYSVNNTFNLTEWSPLDYRPDSGDGASVLTSSVALMIILIIASALIH